MSSKTWQVGNVTITPVFELDAGKVIHDALEPAIKHDLTTIEWLSPFVDAKGALQASNQSFLVKSEGKNILVDPCVGNSRNRPMLPDWANLRTDYLANLKAVIEPEQIDMVVSTHFHFDHVGWNTQLVDGQFVPTFPNAQYLFVKAEYDYWRSKPEGEIEDDLLGIEDSIMPIVKAGLHKEIPDDYQLTAEVSLIPTPGHTPHHISVVINSAGKRAAITGDLFHHPCQIGFPDWSCFDTDKDQAVASRKAFLERFGNTETLIIGSHFAGPIAGYIVIDGGKYKLADSSVARSGS